MSDPIVEAVQRGDLDELVSLVHGLCGSGEWREVVRLRDRCRHALERGLQLWPAAEYAEYRLALDAPAAYAGPVITEGAGRFALGPLWEVAASTHTWEELEDHVPDGPSRALVAHERVVRGEDLRECPGIDDGVLEVPLRLEPWEPRYPVAVFRPNAADFPTPPSSALEPVVLPHPGTRIDLPDAEEALYDLGKVWAEQSNGSCRVVVVDGGPDEAIATLGGRRVGVGSITPEAALAWMAWAGASGGAYGRRRGTAVGRFAAWWAAAAMTGLEWPVAPARLCEAAARLTWKSWEPGDSIGGWALHLAVGDPDEGIAFAVAATDARRDEEDSGPPGVGSVQA